MVRYALCFSVLKINSQLTGRSSPSYAGSKRYILFMLPLLKMAHYEYLVDAVMLMSTTTNDEKREIYRRFDSMVSGRGEDIKLCYITVRMRTS